MLIIRLKKQLRNWKSTEHSTDRTSIYQPEVLQHPASSRRLVQPRGNRYAGLTAQLAEQGIAGAEHAVGCQT